jgi:hypothetical protein
MPKNAQIGNMSAIYLQIKTANTMIIKLLVVFICGLIGNANYFYYNRLRSTKFYYCCSFIAY